MAPSIVHSHMTLAEIMEVAFYPDSIVLDQEVVRLAGQNDEVDSLVRLMKPEISAAFFSRPRQVLGERSDYLHLSRQIGLHQDEGSPKSFTRVVIAAIVCIQARGRDVRGKDVISLLIEMLNRRIIPNVPSVSSIDDPRLSLVTIGWFLAGEGSYVSDFGLRDADPGLREKELLPVPAQHVAASGIVRDEAIVLANCLHSFDAIAVAEKLQKKLVRIGVTLAEREKLLRTKPRSTSQEWTILSRSLQHVPPTEVMAELAIQFANAKTAVGLEMNLKLGKDDFPLIGQWSLDEIVLELTRVVLNSANRSVRGIPALAKRYEDAIKKWETGPYSTKRLEEMVPLIEFQVTGIAASTASIKDSLDSSRARTFMERCHILKELGKAVECWRKLLAIESIVLAEFLRAGPWGEEKQYSDFAELVGSISPHKGRSFRTPGMEVILVESLLVGLLDFEDMQAPADLEEGATQ